MLYISTDLFAQNLVQIGCHPTCRVWGHIVVAPL